MKYLLCLLSSVICALAQTPAPAPLSMDPPETPGVINPALPTIFIASDSTAARAKEPQQGWAVPFADYFDLAKVNISNRALGGRSSRTFITQGWWDKLLADLKAGDYVLIQFGHNDSSPINEEESVPPASRRSRGVIRSLGDETTEIVNILTQQPETIHTYGWYMRKMIAEVQAKGATPIVLSITVRNSWKDGKIDRAAAPWREFSRQIAATAGIAYIDLTRLIADEYQKLGPDKVKEFFPRDATHTGVAGADLNASFVIAGLKGIRRGPFTALLSAKGAAVDPDRAGYLNLPEPAEPKLPSIVLIGDSTVRNGRGDGAGGQWGWGDSLGKFFDPAKVNIVNRAVGGLSSRTFLTQGHWSRAQALIKAGDFVVMQFGHNDDIALNDATRARGTIKGAGEETEEIDNLLTKQHEVVHSFGWYLRKYIRETKAAGATPIVCSLVPRKIWKDGKAARDTATYAGWAKQVAAEEGVAFIDLNDLIATRYEALGQEKVAPLFADEHTHTSKAGADLNAEIVAAGLRQLPAVAQFALPAK